jgi:N-acetylmuramoyl-L-alanine amidase
MTQPGVEFTWRTRTRTTRIIVHDSNTPADLQPSATDHMRTKGRTMGLLDVGYHFVIERDGKVIQTRPHACLGSHAPGHNGDSIGVCLAGGHLGVDDFTGDQTGALGLLLRWLLHAYPGATVLGRYELKGYGASKRNRRSPALDMNQLREGIAMTAHAPKAPAPVAPVVEEPKGIAELSQQNRLVLEYLRSGRTLTNLIAVSNLGVGSLTSRIAELRKLYGEDYIKDETDTDFHKRRYKKYFLEDARKALVARESENDPT